MRHALLLALAVGLNCASGAHAAAPDGACAGFYQPGFQLAEGMLTRPWVVDEPQPARGVPRTDPNWGTCTVRVTDARADGVRGFAHNDYSRRQAFNAGNKLQLVYGYTGGTWHLYDARYRHRKALAALGGDAEPQWHPTDPDLLYFLEDRGRGMTLQQLDVTSGQVDPIADFGARLQARWPLASAASTGSEGSPSADGRYWCFMVQQEVATGSWPTLGVFTWDRDEDAILGMIDAPAGDRPNHVSMTPSGNACVVSYEGANGVQAYSRDLSSSWTVAAHGEHSDIARLPSGDDAYVSVDYGSGDVYMVNLTTRERTALFTSYVDSTATAIHFSGKAYDKPGWAVVSTYAEYRNTPPYTQQWLHRKVFAVQLKANPKIYSLADTQSLYGPDETYYAAPKASASRDLSKVVFNSNWYNAGGNPNKVEVYEVQIKPGLLK